MIHAAALVLSLAAFTALAFAMRGQQRDIIGRVLPRATTLLLRATGTVALLLALGILVAWYGWGLGLVMFSGHTSVAAGIVLCSLVGYARIHASPPRGNNAARRG